MTSVLAWLRAHDAELVGPRVDIDARLEALHLAGVRDVRFDGSPATSRNGHVVLALTAPDGSHRTFEGSRYAVVLDRAERAILGPLRSGGSVRR